jgi:integrase
MAVRKFRTSWWVDFTINGHRYRRRSPENSRVGALNYETTIRQRLAQGSPLDTPPEQGAGRTFGSFAKEWFEQYVTSNNKYAEQRAKKYILSASLVPFFGEMPLAQIKLRDIERFKVEQLATGISKKTLRNRLTVLNKCLATAYAWLELEGVPPKIEWPRCVSNRTDYLSPDECEVLVAAATGTLREMILTTLRTGTRQGEIRGLQWTSIDWESRILTVRHSLCDRRKVLETPKSNKERHIPLDVDVYELLYARRVVSGYVFVDIDGRPFTGGRLNRRLAIVCEKAGLRRITWHVLRHTFATQLAMKGVPLQIVQLLLGHADVRTTMRYAHVAPSLLRPAIDMLNPKASLNSNLGQPAGNTWIETQLKRAA